MPTAVQFQNLVIASLSSADPSAQIDLTSRVPLYWSMYALKARWPDIRFWYTYREACLLVMGRTRRQIDQVRRNSHMAGSSQADSASDGNSVSRTLSLTNDTSDSLSQHGVEKRLDGSMTGDDGHGNPAYNRLDSFRNIVTTQHHDDTGSGSGSGGSYATKNLVNEEYNYSLDAGGNIGTNATLGGSKARIKSTDASVVFTNDVITGAQRLIEGDTDREHDEFFAKQVERIESSENTVTMKGGVQSTVVDRTDITSHQDSHIGFNANVVDGSTIFADANQNYSRGASILVEHSSDIGSTHGMIGPSKHASEITTRTNKSITADGSTVTHDSTVATSQSTKEATAHFQMQKLQQKFLHLNALWKEASQRIKILEQQAVIVERHQVLQAKTTFVDDYNCSPFAVLGKMPMLFNGSICDLQTVMTQTLF